MDGEGGTVGPVVFKALPGLDREAAMLGQVQVGEIMPLPPGQRRHRSAYRVTLPECAAAGWRPAADIDAARRGVLFHVEQWLSAADLRPNGAVPS